MRCGTHRPPRSLFQEEGLLWDAMPRWPDVVGRHPPQGWAPIVGLVLKVVRDTVGDFFQLAERQERLSISLQGSRTWAR